MDVAEWYFVFVNLIFILKWTAEYILFDTPASKNPYLNSLWSWNVCNYSQRGIGSIRYKLFLQLNRKDVSIFKIWICFLGADRTKYSIYQRTILIFREKKLRTRFQFFKRSPTVIAEDRVRKIFAYIANKIINWKVPPWHTSNNLKQQY